MISLCPACHAKIHRTRAVVRLMPLLLVQLWRDAHPKGHEQTALQFNLKQNAGTTELLFQQDSSEKGHQ